MEGHSIVTSTSRALSTFRPYVSFHPYHHEDNSIVGISSSGEVLSCGSLRDDAHVVGRSNIPMSVCRYGIDIWITYMLIKYPSEHSLTTISHDTSSHDTPFPNIFTHNDRHTIRPQYRDPSQNPAAHCERNSIMQLDYISVPHRHYGSRWWY